MVSITIKDKKGNMLEFFSSVLVKKKDIGTIVIQTYNCNGSKVDSTRTLIYNKAHKKT